MTVRGMFQMQWLADHSNTVHDRSRHGVVAASLTMERTGSVLPL